MTKDSMSFWKGKDHDGIKWGKTYYMVNKRKSDEQAFCGLTFSEFARANERVRVWDFDRGCYVIDLRDGQEDE